MEKSRINSAVEPRDVAVSGRSHLVFVAIGVGIVLGGLWLLYASDGPYHPDFPVTENEATLYEGS